MAWKKYIVDLSGEERAELKILLSTGEKKMRKLTRARILLRADDGWSDPQISEALDCSPATV